MDYIEITEATKSELMKKFEGITNSGVLVNEALKFLVKHKDILDSDEYVNIVQQFPNVRPGFFNMMILDTKYSINVK